MITSAANEKLKHIRELLKKKAARDAEGLFVLEGIRQVREAPVGLLREVYVSSDADDLKEQWFTGAYGSCSGGFSVYEVEAGLFGRISDTQNPQGILAVAEKPDFSAVQPSPCPLYLMTERLQDPGNAGTILRTAEAAGADAVYFSADSVDVYAPKVVRAAMGSVFRMPVFYEPDLVKTLQKMHQSGVHSYAAHLAGAVPYDEPDYRKGTVFLIGNEGNGLTAELTAAAEQRILIPMQGEIESLNAAMSAGILMYEAVRQRRG